MASYKEKFDELRRSAEDKVRELDEKFNIRERIEETGKFAQKAAQLGTENLREGAEKLFAEAEKLRVEADKMANDSELTEHARQVAQETAKRAREVGAELRETAETVGKQASEFAREAIGVTPERANEIYADARTRGEKIYTDARDTIGNAAKKTRDAVNFGLGWSRIVNNSIAGISKAAAWTQEKPLQAVGTGFTLLLGLRLGSAMPFLSSHWFVNSALPVWGLRKAGEQFENYLNKREELIKNGELSAAETERVRFERDIVKYVGAPLLGAFSCAAGATMLVNIFNPRTIVGAPISWLLGGNPILEGVWLFGNGVICFKIGVDFFMLALEDHTEVQRIVKEIKGLLPQAEGV